MAQQPNPDPDDSDEGQGDESAYDGLAVEHLNSEAGQREVAEEDPPMLNDEMVV
ncbi:MAG: hypothetical protein WCB04_08560 [Mycobacteriales bacterium]